MSSIEDVFPSIRPVWEINERLVYHSESGSGRMLDGLKYEHEGQKQVLGESDLPRLELFSVTWDNNTFPGAPRERGKKNSVLLPEITVRFRASFSRRNLFFRRNPNDTTLSLGALEWIALIQDAVETTRCKPTLIDAGINGTVSEPIMSSFEELEPTELAFHGMLVLTVKPMPHCRGERSRVDC